MATVPDSPELRAFDHVVLGIANAFEAATPWHTLMPPITATVAAPKPAQRRRPPRHTRSPQPGGIGLG